MNNIEFIDEIKKYKQKFIYGAGVVAYGVYAYLTELEDVTIDAFVVTSKDKEETLAGVEIIGLDELCSAENAFFIIATPEVYHDDIKQLLTHRGFINYICVDYKLEYSLMGAYLCEKKNILLTEDVSVNSNKNTNLLAKDDCRILMAISHRDKKLRTKYTPSEWVKKIQVGASLTDERITELTDCCGFNISEQNGLYGELTAAYYAWKNMKFPIIGLFHYRRVLEIENWMLNEIKQGNIDVILPLPFVCYPDTKGQYGRYLLDEDVEIMWDVLRELSPDYFEAAKEVLSDKYLYNYNMLVARWEVFDAYCNWMFPILQEICARCESIRRERLDRYIGRVGEVLTSIYFLVNKNKWNIGHARKRWLV